MNGIASNTMNGLMDPIGAVHTETTEQEVSVPGMISLKDEMNDSGDDMDAFERKLKKLTRMRETGVLSDEEFEEQKRKLLSEL